MVDDSGEMFKRLMEEQMGEGGSHKDTPSVESEGIHVVHGNMKDLVEMLKDGMGKSAKVETTEENKKHLTKVGEFKREIIIANTPMLALCSILDHCEVQRHEVPHFALIMELQGLTNMVIHNVNNAVEAITDNNARDDTLLTLELYVRHYVRRMEDAAPMFKEILHWVAKHMLMGDTK